MAGLLRGIGRALSTWGTGRRERNLQDEYEERLERERAERRQGELRDWQLQLADMGGGLGSVPEAPRVTQGAGIGLQAGSGQPTPFGEWGTGSPMVPPPDEADTPVSSHLEATGGRVYRPIGEGDFQGYYEDPDARAERLALEEGERETERIVASQEQVLDAARGLGYDDPTARGLMVGLEPPPDDEPPRALRTVIGPDGRVDVIYDDATSRTVEGVSVPTEAEGGGGGRYTPTFNQAMELVDNWTLGLENATDLPIEQKMRMATRLSQGEDPSVVFREAASVIPPSDEEEGPGFWGHIGRAFGFGDESSVEPQQGVRPGAGSNRTPPPPDTGGARSIFQYGGGGTTRRGAQQPAPGETEALIPPPDEGLPVGADASPASPELSADEETLKEVAALMSSVVPGSASEKTRWLQSEGWNPADIRYIMQIVNAPVR